MTVGLTGFRISAIDAAGTIPAGHDDRALFVFLEASCRVYIGLQVLENSATHQNVISLQV